MLIDWLIANPPREKYSMQWENLKKSQVVEVSNVAEYVMRLTKNTREIGQKDVPNVTPPWPITWMEYKVPKWTHQCLVDGRFPVKRYGVLLISSRVNAGREIIYPHPLLEEAFQELTVNNASCFIFEAFHFAEPMGKVLPGYIGSARGLIDDKGSLITSGEGYFGLHDLAFDKMSEDDADFTDLDEDDKNLPSLLMITPLFALTFLNCKNVRVIQNSCSLKLQKARIKKGKAPFVKWKTLEIIPDKTTRIPASDPRKTDIKKSLHIVRGHFAHYTQEAPLFGRVVGTFWKAMHTRGSIKEGIVLKDYSVSGPQN